MTEDRGTLGLRWTALPANSAFVLPWDSTRGPAQMTWAGVATGSPYLAPGPWRGRYPRAVLRYTVKATTDDVTVDEQVLTGNAGTSADWETQGAGGQYTVTAGTTVTREWKALGLDHRLLITAGATAPTALVVWLQVLPAADFGVS